MFDFGEFLESLPSGTTISVWRIAPSSYQGIKCTGFAGTVVQTKYFDAAQDVLDKFGGGTYKFQARVNSKIFICEEHLPGYPKIELEEEPPPLDDKSDLDRAFDLVEKLSKMTKGKDDDFMDEIKHHALQNFLEDKDGGLEKYIPLVTAVLDKKGSVPNPNLQALNQATTQNQNSESTPAPTEETPVIVKKIYEVFKYLITSFNCEGSVNATANSILANISRTDLEEILALNNAQLSEIIVPWLPQDQIMAKKIANFSFDILAIIRGTLNQKDQPNASSDLSP